MSENGNISIPSSLPKFTCRKCLESFETVSERGEHQRREHNYKFICGLCNMEFGWYERLLEHKTEKIHLDNEKIKGPCTQPEYRCGVQDCGQTFPTRLKRGRHQINDHQMKFDCRGCLVKFESLERMQEHLRDVNFHRGENTYTAFQPAVCKTSPSAYNLGAISSAFLPQRPTEKLSQRKTIATTKQTSMEAVSVETAEPKQSSKQKEANKRISMPTSEDEAFNGENGLFRTETEEIEGKRRSKKETKSKTEKYKTEKKKRLKRDSLYPSSQSRVEKYKGKLAGAKANLKATKKERKDKREKWAAEISKLKENNKKLLRMLSEA